MAPWQHSSDSLDPQLSCRRRPLHGVGVPTWRRGSNQTVRWKLSEPVAAGVVRQYGKKAQTDERGRLESAAGEVRMRRLDTIVEADDLMMNLRADTADEPVAKRRHLAKQDRRAWLGLSIRLRKRRERDVALSHDLRSATVYSGSSSP
jgi:hypothetical protein